MFDTPLELGDMVLRLLAACAGGMAIGWERESKNKPAGLRTNILVAVGSAGFTLVSWNLTAHLNAGANDLRVDPLRLVQGIIGGIGFLGAGAIIQSHGTVRGMTTAAGIWVVGGIGIACGLGEFLLAALVVAITIAVLYPLGRFENQVVKQEDDAKKNGDESN